MKYTSDVLGEFSSKENGSETKTYLNDLVNNNLYL